MHDLWQEANKRHIPIKEKMKGGTSWRVGGETDFYYLWPDDTFYEGNDDSLVLYMQQKGGFTALFTGGDLEQYGEQQLIKRYGPLLANLTLLKAGGHHGSKTSSSEAFVELLQPPQLTVFSAGLHNRYGHPHEEVVQRFVSRHLVTWTTG